MNSVSLLEVVHLLEVVNLCNVRLIIFKFLKLFINVIKIIYTLFEDLNGEEIKGLFYLFELISVANKN